MSPHWGARSVASHHSEVIAAAAESKRPNSTLKNIFLGEVAQRKPVENMVGDADTETGFGIVWDRRKIKEASMIVLSICVELVLCTSKDQYIDLVCEHCMIDLRELVREKGEGVVLSKF